MADSGPPERMCIGCRAKAPKASLLRIVRDPQGGVTLDRTPSRSAPGRGAYLHRDHACIDAAAGSKALARALRTGLGEEELSRLRDDIEQTGAS